MHHLVHTLVLRRTIWQHDHLTTHYPLHVVLCMKSNCEANINKFWCQMSIMWVHNEIIRCHIKIHCFLIQLSTIITTWSWNGIISFKKILQLLCGDTECFNKRKYLDYDDVLTQSCWKFPGSWCFKSQRAQCRTDSASSWKLNAFAIFFLLV